MKSCPAVALYCVTRCLFASLCVVNNFMDCYVQIHMNYAVHLRIAVLQKSVMLVGTAAVWHSADQTACATRNGVRNGVRNGAVHSMRVVRQSRNEPR